MMFSRKIGVSVIIWSSLRDGSFIGLRDILVSFSVAQESIFGPLIFNVFTNDLVYCMELDCILCAEDVKILKEISTLELT